MYLLLLVMKKFSILCVSMELKLLKVRVNMKMASRVREAAAMLL